MSVHRAVVHWRSTDAPFTYETYTRAHVWRFEGGAEVQASAAPSYRGDPDLVDPEEAFVASLASCHLLTFLAIAAREGLVVEDYQDAPEGVLERNDAGRFSMTRVVLRPRVTFGGAAPALAPDVLARLHARAHEECFIANSVRTEVLVEPR